MIRRWLSRTRTPTLIFTLVLLAGLALAASFTPSGTLIEAQASATFVDSAQVQRETLSNLVITVVQTVVKVQVSGTPERSAVAGASVDLPFTVTNAGNDRDSIDLSAGATGDPLAGSLTLTIVADQDCNGRADAGEPTVAAITLDPGERGCVVVRANLAAGASGTSASVTLTAESAGDTVVDGDDQAASSGTVTLVTAGTLTLNLRATPTSSVAQGGRIDVTLDAVNSGAAAVCAVGDGVLLAVPIPAGLTLSATDAVATSGGGSASVVFRAVADGPWLTERPASVAAIGLLAAGSGCFFPQGAAAQLTFGLEVPSGHEPHAGPAAGSSYDTVATATYATTAGGSAASASSNTLTHTVSASYEAGIDDPNPTLATATSGSTISLTTRVRNLGNADDRFTVALTAPAGSDWVCRLYRADGVTPLTGSVGPLAPNGTSDVVTRCTIPAADTTDGRTVRLDVASLGDAAQTASSTWTITTVTSGLSVDLALEGAPAVGAKLAPGATLTFFSRLENDGANPDGYDLSAALERTSSTGAPSTWSASTRFYPATVTEGGCEAITPTPSAVVTTGIVPAGASRCFEVAVAVPSTATSDWTGRVTITATSQSNANVSAGATTAPIGVTLTPGVSFAPDRSTTITSPGITTVTHTLRNTGNAPATVSLSTVLSPSGTGGALYAWGGGEFRSAADAPDQPIAVGEELTLHVRFAAASGQPPGRRITLTTTATVAYEGAAPVERSVTTTYDVIDGLLRLHLDVCTSDSPTTCSANDGAAARPGQYLRYTLVASNLGAAAVPQVIVTEPIPAFTTFVSVSAERSSGFTSGTLEYSSDGVNWTTTAPASVATGGALRVRVIDGASDVPIPSGASITITLVTRVK